MVARRTRVFWGKWLLFCVITELSSGILAYNVRSWNFRHTAIISGWEGVRETCLIEAPLLLGLWTAGIGLILGLMRREENK